MCVIFLNFPYAVSYSHLYQCEIQFREPVNLIKKSYPIAFSLKEAVRTEINRLTAENIIEPSYSPYTSPVSYTHLDVYKRQNIHNLESYD